MIHQWASTLWLKMAIDATFTAMSIISLVIILVVIGVILWLINTKIPMDNTIKQIINVVVLIVVLLWLLSAFGVIGEIDSVRVPKIN